MSRVVSTLLCTALAVPAQSAPDSIARVGDLGQLPRLEAGVTSGLFSSTDPSGSTRSHYLRTSGSRHLLAEMTGPGVVVRLAATNPEGVLHVTLDDEPVPRLECPFAELGSCPLPTRSATPQQSPRFPGSRSPSGNSGSRSSRPLLTACYRSTHPAPQSGETLLVFPTRSGDWGAFVSGLYTTIGGTVPANMPAGSYYVGAIFDNTGVVGEQFESDNAAVLGQVTVTNSLRSLSVLSTNPSSGVSITASPLDSSGLGAGTTGVSRTDWNSEAVTLTAPASQAGAPFKRWRLDGVDQALGVTTLGITMNAAHTATADYYQRVAGSFTTFGTACKGSNNLLPVHSASAPKGYPFLGDTTTYQLSSARANTGVALYFGASNTLWGTTPLPFALGPTGIPGCTLYVSVDASISLTTNAGGVASMSATVPNNPALIGGTLYTQFAIVDIGAPYAVPIPHSNAMAHRIGGDL